MNDQDRMAAGRRAFLQSAALAVTATAAQTASPEKLRLGVVGAGLRGTFLSKTLAAMAAAGEPVEIAAVCDIYQPRLERAETRWQAKGFKNTADMLREARLDAVVLATPDRHHLYNLQEALRAGKDVYVEKPLCHWDQFDLLKQVVHENRQHKRIVQVGSQYLADPVWVQGAALMQTGIIGKPAHIQIPNFRNNDAGERAMMTVDDPNAKDGVGVDWKKFQADAPPQNFNITRLFQWRLFMEYSGGPLTDTGPHEMCPVYKILQPGFPNKVVATGGHFYWNHDRTVPDTMDVLIQYPQGFTVALLETYINNHFPVEKLIRGTEGTARFTNDAFEIYPMTRVPYGTTRPPIIELKPSCRLLTVRGQVLASATGTERPLVPDATMLHMKDFLDSVRARKQPRFDLELGYIVQIPLCMAMRSLLENKAALFDLKLEQIVMS